jgi:hypothetical protein
MSFQQAGCRRVVADVGDEIFRDWLPAVLRCFSTSEARFQKQIRIVDSCGDVFSDPGANPGASIYYFARWGPFDIPHLAARSGRRFATLPSGPRLRPRALLLRSQRPLSHSPPRCDLLRDRFATLPSGPRLRPRALLLRSAAATSTFATSLRAWASFRDASLRPSLAAGGASAKIPERRPNSSTAITSQRCHGRRIVFPGSHVPPRS